MPPDPSPFAFSQIAEMNSTPADIPIPELENLRRGLAPAFAPTQQLTGQEETARALEKMRDFQARTVVQGKMSEGAIPPNSMTVNSKDGTMDIKGLSIDTYQAIMRDREELNNIRGSFAQEAARLQAQETQARSQPWAQLATALSANLAQAPNLPGWVQAAGRTAAQLNPTADQLRNQRLQVLGEEAQIAEKASALDIASGRFGMEQVKENRLVAEEQRKVAEDKTRDVRDARDKLLVAAGKGEAPPPEVVGALFAEQGLDPKKAAAYTQAISGTNAAALQRKIEDEKRATALQKQKDDAQMQRELSKEAASLKLREASAARLDAKDADKKQVELDRKEFKAYEKVATPLQNLLTLDSKTDELRKSLDEAERENRAIGPVGGRIPNIFVSQKTAKLRSDMITMVAAINDAVIKGGTRLWNPTEWKALSPKLVEAIKTGAFNRGILDSIEEFTQNTRKAIVDTQQDVNWKKRRSSLGNQADVLAPAGESTEDAVTRLLGSVKPR